MHVSQHPPRLLLRRWTGISRLAPMISFAQQHLRNGQSGKKSKETSRAWLVHTIKGSDREGRTERKTNHLGVEWVWGQDTVRPFPPCPITARCAGGDKRKERFYVPRSCAQDTKCIPSHLPAIIPEHLFPLCSTHSLPLFSSSPSLPPSLCPSVRLSLPPSLHFSSPFLSFPSFRFSSTVLSPPERAGEFVFFWLHN